MASPPGTATATTTNNQSQTFVFNAVDDRSLSHLRNSSSFSLLFDERNANMVYKVISLPGHIAVLIKQRSSPSSNPPHLHALPTLLCIFDNVSTSTSFSISSSASSSSKEWINAIQCLPTPSTSSSTSLGGVFVSQHCSPIHTVLFDAESKTVDEYKTLKSNNNPLRVLVVESSGDVFAWQWNGPTANGTQQPTDNSWRTIGKATLPGYIRNANNIESIVFVPSEQKLFYLIRIDTVEIKLCACDVSFCIGPPPSELPVMVLGAKRETLFSYSCPKANDGGEEESKFTLHHSPKQGIWITSKHLLLFYNFRSKSYHHVPFETQPKDSINTRKDSISSLPRTRSSTLSSIHQRLHPSTPPSSITGSILSCTVHPTTGDLIIFDRIGNITAFSGGIKGAAGKHLLQIHLQSKVFALMFVHRHIVGFISSECGVCTIADLRNGTLLGEARIPQTYSLLSKKRSQSGASVEQKKELDCHYQLCETGLLKSAFDVIVWSSAGGGVWKLVMPSVRNQINATAHSPSPSAPIVLNVPSTHLSAPLSSASLSSLHMAVKTCGDWKIVQWQAKYALDALQLANKSGDVVMKREMYKQIAPLLQNPSLAIALLSSGDSPLHDAFVINELENYLRTFYCAPLDADKVLQFNTPQRKSMNVSLNSSLDEGKRIAVRLAFHVHTPLNIQMSPLLGEFLQKTLREQNTQNEPKSLVRRRRRKQSVLAMTKNEDKNVEQNRLSITNIERAHLESLARLDPTQTLQRLEVAMNLSNFEDYVSYASPPTSSSLSLLVSPPSPPLRTATSLLPTPRDELWKIPEEELTVLLMKGVRNPIHPYFEIMCRLYYQTKPILLLPFVELIASTATKHPSHQPIRGKRIPNFHERALMSLPVLINIDSEHLSTAQIEARVQLLLKCSRLSEAIEILLQTKKYDKAIKILQDKFKSHPNQLEHYELFHLLLADSLHRKDSEMCKNLFNFVPSNLRVLDLLKVISYHLSIASNLVDSSPMIVCEHEEGDPTLTVDLFRPLLLNLFSREHH